MIKRVLLLVVLVAVLVVPGAAYSDEREEWTDTSGSGAWASSNYVMGSGSFNRLYFSDITKFSTLNYIGIVRPADVPAWTDGRHEITYTFNGQVHDAVVYVDRTRSPAGVVTSTRFTIFLHDFDVSGLTGTHYATLSRAIWASAYVDSYTASKWTGDSLVSLRSSDGSWAGYSPYTIMHSSGIQWHSLITLEEAYDTDVAITLQRAFSGKSYASKLDVIGPSGTLYSSFDAKNVNLLYAQDLVTVVNVTSPSGTVYSYPMSLLSLGDATVAPCTINVYDADTRLPISGAWDYYIVMQGYDSLSGSGSGAFASVSLPATSVLQPHMIRVTKAGYEHVGAPQMFGVPVGGTGIKVYLRDMNSPATGDNVILQFACTDADSGAPVSGANLNLNGTTGRVTGDSGIARFEVPRNSSYPWVASSGNHWPMGGTVEVGVEDLTVPVALVRKTSELPRPPIPDLPNFPVIHPSLDPAGFRMQILNVPLLGGLASPLLDTVDSLGVGLNDMATAILDVLTVPADEITGAVSSVGQNLVDTAMPYLVTSSLLLQVIGAVVSCIPEQVCGLVTFGLLLDIVRILLWGPA